MSSITEKAMLTAVHISLWTAQRHDKRVSSDVAQRNNADVKAGRYNKRLMSKEATGLEALRVLASQIRAYVYKNTLPWSDEGLRLLPASMYFEFNNQLRTYKAQFVELIEQFLAQYPTYKEQMRPILGDLFREEDYPSADKLREKFDIQLEVLPVPAGNDFRVALSEEEQTRIAKQIDQNVRKALERGSEELWSRLYTEVHHMALRLSTSNAKLRASVIGRTRDLAGLLPRLNVAQDAELDTLTAQIKTDLCANDIGKLKHNTALRDAVAKNAWNFVERIKTAMLARNYGLPDVPELIEEDAATTTAAPAAAGEFAAAPQPSDAPAPPSPGDTATMPQPTAATSEPAPTAAVDTIVSAMSDYMSLISAA